MKLFRRYPHHTGGEEIDPERHTSVRLADPYSFRVAHRRLAWMLRLSVGMNIMLIACLSVSVFAIKALLPLKETQIALVRFEDETDRMVRIEPVAEDVAGLDLHLEKMVRGFVRDLLEIDAVTQTERFRRVFSMMDRAFYKRFRDERFEAVEEAIDSGIVRTITIEGADQIDSLTEGVWKFNIELTQVDSRAGIEVERKSLRAYVSLVLRDQNVRPESRYENPLGITVTNLALKIRGEG